VHRTHSSEEDLDRFLATGAKVSVTPFTEANLADGIPPTPDRVPPRRGQRGDPKSCPSRSVGVRRNSILWIERPGFMNSELCQTARP
jgi:hypothetical protein